ncbi:MAG: carbonic anhydrase family protein [Planctomycetota bacterium]
MKRLIYLAFLIILFPVACNLETRTNNNITSRQVEKEVYESTNHNHIAPSKKRDGTILPGLEHGLIQSPINILTKTVEHVENRAIAVSFKDEVEAVENLGHTIQLDFAEGSTITAHGKIFRFKQMHFHTPSEHLLDGMTFPMELHIVNSAVDAENGEVEFLVVSILFKMGDENPFISEFYDLIPKEENTVHKIQTGRVKLSDLLMVTRKDESEEGLYFYKGSLTTPPYSESVNWYIDRHIYEASQEQIQNINKIQGYNARDVQEIYGRVIEGS